MQKDLPPSGQSLSSVSFPFPFSVALLKVIPLSSIKTDFSCPSFPADPTPSFCCFAPRNQKVYELESVRRPIPYSLTVKSNSFANPSGPRRKSGKSLGRFPHSCSSLRNVYNLLPLSLKTHLSGSSLLGAITCASAEAPTFQ